MKLTFKRGVIQGFPICLGYLSVSFGFGITAVANGLTPLQATLISALNLTSAGQAAGVGIIAAMGSYIEIILSQFIINLRYALMGISLSQKLDSSFTIPHRIAAAFGITDEIFAVAYSQDGKVKPSYMYGMVFISWLGWVGGTLLGSLAGTVLPAILTGALGIMLYAMFIAIVVPPAKENRNILFAVLLAVLLSTAFYYLAPFISSGFAIIICAVIASVTAALLFPVKEAEE
ncbi:MAG: AzlC family ABC transporter permease [Acutalibacteraceae bacterium]|nr:AzlC family ABC transporter permease [Acutalibacteraceae bacterium]